MECKRLNEPDLSYLPSIAANGVTFRYSDSAPEDCTRWTAQGLKYFLAECGFPLENIRSAGWGNRACAKANFKRWARTGWGILHSLKNEKRFPVMVWALARKPLSP